MTAGGPAGADPAGGDPAEGDAARRDPAERDAAREGPGQGDPARGDAARQDPVRGAPAEGDAARRSPRPGLSVAIGAQDEEDRLPRTLDSVAWADEVVVADAGSTDRTREIARARGAVVRELGEWPGDGPQKQEAVDRATGPWVLVLDADEVVSPELGREIRHLLSGDPEAAGYELRFLTRYLGGWIGRRGWHREHHLRLFRKDRGEITPRRLHASVRVRGPVGRLRHPVLHHTYRDVLHHAEKIREYAELKALDKHGRGRSTSLPGAAGHGAAAFLSEYLLRGRFLDGWRGLVFCLMSGWATLLAYVRLWELDRGSGRTG